MEKPVRIIGTEKIRTFNEKVRNGLEHALNFMLATPQDAKIAIGGFEPFLMPVEAYLGAYRKRSVMVKIHAERAFQGELYWFFEMKTAVALGGMLRMLLPPVLADKVEQEIFDEGDRDAFGEVGNQLCGILDRAFRALTRKDIHLRMDFEKKIYPNENIRPEAFLDKEEYVVLLSDITLPGQGRQKLTLLLPRSLYEVLLNIEIELDGIVPRTFLVYSWSQERVEKLQAELNCRRAKVLALADPADALTALDTPGLTGIGMDLKPVSFPLSHGDGIFFKRLLTSRAFMQVPLFLSWDGHTEEGARELRAMGFTGASIGSLADGFAGWVRAIMGS